MANTKFPLNGRVATLGDLVHEYGLASSWPVNKTGIGEFQGWSTLTGSPQPFRQLVFQDLGNDEYEAITPYEIVWFNNIYAQDKFDPLTKMRKIIQIGDTSVFGFDRYIIASQISNQENINSQGIEYRFIIPNKVIHTNTDEYGDDQSHYYYDYKLDNGESTVIYSLQNIIDAIDSSTHEDVYHFLFGNDTIDDNQVLIVPESSETLYPLFYSIDVSNNQEIIELDDSNNKIYVKPDAYEKLGQFYWTNQNIQYFNYTIDCDYYAPRVHDTGKTMLDLKRLIYYICKKMDPNPDAVTDEITDVTFGESASKSLLMKSVEIELLFYTYWFLTTQRYHTSFITTVQFIKISNMTYMPSQPVLRCDINFERFIEEFIILDAHHTQASILPAGPLENTTLMVFNISYSAKYRNVGKKTESSFELPLTFQQLKQISSNNETSLLWARFYLPGGSPPELNKSEMTGERYGEDYFPFIDNNNDNFWSLKNIIWPVNDSQLKIPKKSFDAAKNDITFQNGNCYGDTYDIHLYGTTAENIATKIYDYNHPVSGLQYSDTFPPGGMIRIHNTYTLTNPVDSSYYFDASIYRRKNYYYEVNYGDADATEAEGNLIVNLYFEPLYRQTPSNNVYSDVPNTRICSFIKGKSETQPTSLSQLQQLFTEDTTVYDCSFVSMPDNINSLYLTIKSLTGKMYYFVSGDSSFISSGGTQEYITYNKVYVDRYADFGNDIGMWYNYDEQPVSAIQYIIPSDYEGGSNSQTETQTNIIINTDVPKAGFYYYRMHFANDTAEGEEMFKNYVYFRINHYDENLNDKKFTIRYLMPENCLDTDTVPTLKVLKSDQNRDDVYLNKTAICFITYHKETVEKSNLKYTALTYINGLNSAESDIRYRSDIDKLWLRVTAVQDYDVTGFDRFIYKQRRNAEAEEQLIYFCYMLNTSYSLTNDKNILKFLFFNDNKVFTDNFFIHTGQIYPGSAARAYISFMPVYIFYYMVDPLPGGLSDVKLNKLSYARGTELDDINYNENMDSTIAKDYMVLSMMKDTTVYLKPENISLKVNGTDTDLSDPDNIFFGNYKVNVAYLEDTGTELRQQIGILFSNNNEVDADNKPTQNNINYIAQYNIPMVKFKPQQFTMIRLTFVANE